MNNPKRNHYVPEKLSGAWRHDSRHIFQLDKDAASTIPKSVSINDAGVKDFYIRQKLKIISGATWNLLHGLYWIA